MATDYEILGHTLEEVESMSDEQLLVVFGPLIELEPKADLKARSAILNEDKKKDKKEKSLKSKKDELSKLLLAIDNIKT